MVSECVRIRDRDGDAVTFQDAKRERKWIACRIFASWLRKVCRVNGNELCDWDVDDDGVEYGENDWR